MAYRDLPANWTELPLDDPVRCADVVDLLLGFRDRARNSLLLLPRTQAHVPLLPLMIIEDVPWNENDVQPLLGMWAHLANASEGPLLISTSHPGDGQPAQHRAWLDDAVAGLTGLGIPVLGTFTAARDGVYRHSC